MPGHRCKSHQVKLCFPSFCCFRVLIIVFRFQHCIGLWLPCDAAWLSLVVGSLHEENRWQLTSPTQGAKISQVTAEAGSVEVTSAVNVIKSNQLVHLFTPTASNAPHVQYFSRFKAEVLTTRVVGTMLSGRDPRPLAS